MDVDIPPAGYMSPSCCGDDVGSAFFGFMESYSFYRAGDYWTPGGADMSESDPGDAVCCDHVDDCVYQGECYDDDGRRDTAEVLIGGREMNCYAGVWCPRYYVWNPSSSRCEYPSDVACYSNEPGYTTTCQSPFGSPAYHDDIWSSPLQDCYDANNNPNRACCPFLDVGGTEYYLYADVVLY